MHLEKVENGGGKFLGVNGKHWNNMVLKEPRISDSWNGGWIINTKNIQKC